MFFKDLSVSCNFPSVGTWGGIYLNATERLRSSNKSQTISLTFCAHRNSSTPSVCVRVRACEAVTLVNLYIKDLLQLNEDGLGGVVWRDIVLYYIR